MNGSLVDMIIMLPNLGLNNCLWAEALIISCYNLIEYLTKRTHMNYQIKRKSLKFGVYSNSQTTII